MGKLVGAIVTFALVSTMVPLQAVASESTTSVSVGDTTTADFAAGALTSVVTTDVDGGGLTLPPPVNSFSGSSLPSMWTVEPSYEGGNAAITDGQLAVQGANVLSTSTYKRVTSIEFDATFRQVDWQQVGFTEARFAGPDSAIFSTWEDGQFSIYCAGQRIILSNNYLNAKHRYKISWNSANFVFLIDNQQVATVTATLTDAMQAGVMDWYKDSVPLVVDDIVVGSFSQSGTATSRVMDAGAQTSWGIVDWNAQLPTNTTVAIAVRGGNTPTPGVGWSSFKTVASGTSMGLNARYLQYRTTLTTKSFGKVPVLQHVNFHSATGTGVFSSTDATAVDFARGSRGAGILSNVDDGELSFAPTNGSTTFSNSGALPSNWNSTPWAGGGTWSTADDLLTVDGAQAGSIATFSRGSSIEFDAIFTGVANQHGGFGLDYANAANAMFSTQEGDGMWIYANGSRAAVSSSFLGSWHRYKVAWGTSVITFSVDGAVVGTLSWSNTTPKRALFADTSTSGGVLSVDNVALTTYAGTYSYLSHEFDAGTIVTWSTAQINAAVPAKTGFTIKVRTRSGSTWGPYKTLGADGLIDLTARYAQYLLQLTSTDPMSSPVVQDVTLNWVPDTSTTTTTIPGDVTTTTTTTAPPSPVSTTVEMEDVTASYGENSLSLMATVSSSSDSDVDEGTASFQIMNSSGAPVGQRVDVDVFGGVAWADYVLPDRTKPGAYTVNVTYQGTSSFRSSATTASLVIMKASLNVKADNKTMTFGGVMPALTVAYTGFRYGEGVSNLGGSLQLSTTATASSSVGTYPISVSGLTSTDYDITFVNGTLTIAKAQLTITAENKNKTYGSVNPALTVSYSGFVGSDGPSSLGGSLGITTAASAGSPVGDYVITVSGLTSNVYAITYVNGTLTVTPAPLTVRVDDKTKAYGAIVPGLTASYEGFVNGDGPMSLTTMPVVATSATSTSPVGVYVITVSGASSPNYTITHVDGSLTVGRATIVVTVDSASRSYGQANPAFTATFDGFVNGDGPASLHGALVFQTDAMESSPVGTYVVRVSGVSSSNYDVEFVDGVLTIEKSVVTVDVVDASKIYGSTNPSFTASISGLREGDDIGVPTFVTSATTDSDVGSYVVSATGLDATNHEIIYVDGLLTVTPAPLNISAVSTSRVYGSVNPSFGVRFDGFVNGDDEFDLDGEVVVSTDAIESSDVGTYALQVSGPRSKNYDIAFSAATLTVVPAAVTASVNDATRVYGADNPAFEISVAGLVNGDTASVLGVPRFATLATRSSDTGSYVVHVHGLSAQNYVVQTIDGTLTVTPAALTVRADDKFMVYGSTAPALTATYDGFVNGDDVSSLDVVTNMSTSVSSFSAAGSYAITAPDVRSANYTIIAVDGVLTVGRAAISATVDSAARVYGSENPDFTVSYTGFVNGDGPSVLRGVPAFSTDADLESPVGAYVVRVEGLTAHNYDIVHVDGVLVVDPAPLTVTVDSASRVYGDSNPTFTATVAGAVNGDVLEGLTFSTEAIETSDVGEYIVTARGLTAPNYDVTYVDGTLVVTKAALVATAESSAKVYGAAVPDLSAAVAGLRNDDVAPVFTVTTEATPSSDVGRYATSIIPVDVPNYDVTYVDGSLGVTQANVTVIVQESTRTYGSDNPMFSFSAVGLVNGDDLSALGTAEFVTSATKSSSVGDHAVQVTGLTSSNYSIETVDGILHVVAAPLVIAADDKFKTYGSDVPAFTASYSGFVNDDTIESLELFGAFSTNANVNSPTGTYVIVPPAAMNPNYAISYVNGTLTVGAAVLTVSVDDTSRAYGSANPSFTASYSGFVNGDGPSVLRGEPIFITTATQTSDVGTYGVSVDGLASRDYEILYVDGTLTVTPATLTVKVNDATRLYGSADPTFSYTVSGFVNDETSSKLTGDAVYAAPAATVGVGVHPVSVSGLSASNYIVAAVPGWLVVEPATLTVEANDASRPYGAVNPAFSVSYAGFVNGDSAAVIKGSPVVETSATTTSNAGSYLLTPSGVSADNYTVIYGTGTLTVTPAALTIKADDKTKVAGQVNPTLTATMTGFVNGETQLALTGTLSLATTATTASGAGTYPITASGVSSTNYVITFVPGTLTVTAPPIDDTDVINTQIYIKSLDVIGRMLGGYTLTRQLVDCKTGAAIGSPLNIQSRSTAGVLKVHFDFKDVTVNTCWTVKLTFTKTGSVVESKPFAIRSKR